MILTLYFYWYSSRVAMEVISPEGLRNDGRRPHELRRFVGKLCVSAEANGSAYVEMGNSKILVAVYGPREVLGGAGRSKITQEEACVNCEVALSEFCSTERKDSSKNDRPAAEIASAIEEIFESAILTHLYPESQIDIFIEVLEADGSLVAAAVNASTLAVMQAGLPMRDFVCASTVSLVNDEPVVDLNHLEELLVGSILTLAVMPTRKSRIFLDMSSRFHLTSLEVVTKAAEEACEKVYLEIRDLLSKLVEYVGSRMKPES
ncbi:unnamed protein product [Notodromas monacha]|uniref:Putative exosome complex component RRP41 n=1 Tax=Notodromas monacha TaxID=399045 RepID=A0A7R9BK85_9CRUS|nr:unnamed protein product [Notodromas monacha]CAG0917020.1 unnamed protein product [Notodromas monacha]